METKTINCDSGDILVSSVTIEQRFLTLTKDGSTVLHVIVCPLEASNRNVTWRSDDSCVASVNPTSGLIYAHNVGETLIYAKSNDGTEIEDQCRVTVIENVPVEKITLDNSDISLDKGETKKLNATVTPSDAVDKRVRWTSDNPSVASVDQQTGLVTANSAGEAKIYATSVAQSEVSAYCNVLVTYTNSTSVEETPVNKSKNNYARVPVDLSTGAHLMSNTVMTMFGGQGLKLTLNYNSTQLFYGDFGKGWYHNFEKRVVINDRKASVYNTPSVFSKYVADNDCATRFVCTAPNKNGYVLTVDHTREYPYVVDCNSERTEYYNSKGDLARIVDHQGFETLITYSGALTTIKDCVSGKSIYLEKGSNCNVCRVYDDYERVATFTYNNADHLMTICDVNGNTLKYTYDSSGRVLTGTDAKNICFFENTYDRYGRVSEQKDAIPGSLKTVFSYDGNKRIATNRNGKQSVREYNENGLLSKYTDENGNSTTYEYDSRFNIINEIDAKGRYTVKAYNRFNKPSEVTDKNGNKTCFTYDSSGNLTKIRYPAIGGVSAEENFVYNSHNQVTQHTDMRGTVTVYTYDANRMPASKKVGSKNAILYSYQNGLLKSQTDARGYTTGYSHNAMGQVIAVTDADNKVTQYTYDKSGNLLSTTDANGKTITTAYDGNYQKTSVTDSNGNRTEYSYNGNMKNTVVTLPDNNTIHYEYDGEDRVVKITDQANNVTRIEYDDAGRVRFKRFPDQSYIEYRYDEVGNVVKEINPKGGVITKEYDDMGNVVLVVDDKENLTIYQYNAMSKVCCTVNGKEGTTLFGYSSAGDLVSELDAFNHIKTYSYDAFGNRLTETDAKNNVTTYTYDQNDNLLTVKDALGNITTYTYDCLNRCVSVKDARNNVIQYGYDALGRRTTVTDARGNVFTTTYDGNGNVLKTTDAKGNIISQTVYNCLNKPLLVTDAVGNVTSYTYNALGKVESITDSMNHRTEYSYNSRGQNTFVRDAADNTSTCSYDVLGNVTRLAGPLGGATNYTYDDMGRLVSESTSSGGTKRYEYNELNIRKKITNARNQVRNITHDVMGRITSYTTPEGTVSYTYDANGNVLTVTDNNGTVSRTYDALNRVVKHTDKDGMHTRYEYDAVGNLTKIIYLDYTSVTYAYDENNNLIRVTDWANRVTSYSYDVNNRVIGVTKPDGSVTTTVYDNMHRVTSTVERTSSGTVISGFEYTYDDLSRIVEEKNLANNTKMCYTYDSLSRVTVRTEKNAMTNAVISTETYSYDAAGNITDAPDSCFAYDTDNKLTVFKGKNVRYDADGNMLTNGFVTCAYDSSNRLVSAGDLTYTYDAEDTRIKSKHGVRETSYVYDTNCKLSRLLIKLSSGTATKYVYGLGLIGEETGGLFKTYHFDSRGSTIAITDTTGNITDTFAYDTYGKCISRTGTSDIIFGYNGKYGVITDSNGLIYMRARYYSPDMKRFINADIIPGSISNAITLNRYAYANGNPVSFVDPFGLSVALSLLALGALGVGSLLALTGCSNQKESTAGETRNTDTNNGEQVEKAYSAEQAKLFEMAGIPYELVEDNTKNSTKYALTDNPPTVISNPNKKGNESYSEYDVVSNGMSGVGYLWDIFEKPTENAIKRSIRNSPRPNNIGVGTYGKIIENDVEIFSKQFGYTKYAFLFVFTAVKTGMDYEVNIQNGESNGEIISDAAIDVGSGVWSVGAGVVGEKVGGAIGTAISPGIGTVAGKIVGYGAGLLIGWGLDYIYNEWMDPMLDNVF